MDEKIKLNSKMNWHIFVTDFWINIIKVGSRTVNFATRRAEINVKRNMEILDEMMKLDYDENFKTQLAELSGKGS